MRKPNAAEEVPSSQFGRIYQWTGIPRSHRMVYCLIGITGLLLVLTLILFFSLHGSESESESDLPVWGDRTDDSEDSEDDAGQEDDRYPYATKSQRQSYLPVSSADTAKAGAVLTAKYALLLRGDTLESLAERDADTVMYPASLTKIMTLVTAMDLITDLKAQVVITKEQVDYAYAKGAKTIGFEVGEVVTVEDLLYAVSLESCAVSSLALARELAGGETEFVARMNEKAAELGLQNTHFTNTVGLHDNDHYTTARELAAIFAYAMENELCKTVLTAYSYRTVTNVHASGITSYSTLLRDRFEDNRYSTELKSGHTVLGGKTGYTAKAGYCLATYSEDGAGTPYLLITCGGTSSISTVEDCIAMLRDYGSTGE